MSESNEHTPHFVRIHIDRAPYESPDPTTGAALYSLAAICPHRDLFRERSGDHEDELIERDDEKVHLKQDEHFYSQKDVHLIVNGQKKPWSETRISYE